VSAYSGQQTSISHCNKPTPPSQASVHLAELPPRPEPTVRRLRQKLSSSRDEDGVRVVTRGGTTYELNARKIGTNSKGTRPRSRHSLRVDLAAMKENSSAAARPLLVIIEHWLLGQSESARCLDAIERFLHGQHTGSAT